MDEQDCETCLHYDGLEGECKLDIADNFEVRSCDTSECEKYEIDPFYKALGDE
jgi:hypothetical protein